MTKNYHSYMLRLKQLQADGIQTWVVSMQNTQTGHQQVFSSINGLLEFLQTEFGSGAGQKENSQSDAHIMDNSSREIV